MKRFLILSVVGCLVIGSNLSAGSHLISVPSKALGISGLDSVISKVKSFTKNKEKTFEVSLDEYKEVGLEHIAVPMVGTKTMQMKGQDFETLASYLSSAKQAIAALNSCSQAKDGFRSYLKDVLWSCSYELNNSFEETTISIDFGAYQACATSLKTIFNRREEVTKVKPTTTEKELLNKLDLVIHQLKDASAGKSEKISVPENTDKRLEKKNALKKLMSDFASDKSLETVKGSDLCKLETIVGKTGSQKIVDEDSKNKFEKEAKKSEEPQDLDAGKLQGVPAGGLTDKVAKDEKAPPKDPVVPSPTGISPVPAPIENNATLPFDFGGLLSSLLNNANQNQVQLPNIRTTGNRDVRQGNNNEVAPTNDSLLPTPTPETSPEPTPSATPSATPPTISLPSAATSSASSGVSGLENLGKNLGIPVAPVATPNSSANADIMRAAELAGQKKRDEMMAELRRLGSGGGFQQQAPASGSGLLNGTVNRGNSLLNRYNLNGNGNTNFNSNSTQQFPLSTDEVRGDLGRINGR